jgi:very-short-patch-repair endonuclease
MAECGAPRKDAVVRFLNKNFVENVHFKMIASGRPNARGGQNAIDVMMTEEAATLVIGSYKLKHRYAPLVGGLKQTNIIMTLENSTIGFMCKVLESSTPVVREYKIGPYRVDLFIPAIKMVVECDEMGHERYDASAEIRRNEYLEHAGYNVIRFNPNDESFDFSAILSQVVKYLLDNK